MVPSERRKFLLFGLMFGFIIGIYWMFSPVRDAFFGHLVNPGWLYYAKILSVAAILPALYIYGRLVDYVTWYNMFYVLSACFSLTALMFFFLLQFSSYGLGSEPSFIGNVLGFAWYIWVDSFGALMVALFWSFAAETTDPQSAKRGYPIAVFGAQVGGILGPLISLGLLRYGLPVTYILLFAIVGIAAISWLAWYIKNTVPERYMQGFYGSRKADANNIKIKSGFIEGLTLLLRNHYLMAIFGILALHELVMAFVEYRFKIGVLVSFASADDSAWWLYVFGMLVNLSAMLSIIFGVNKIARRWGLGRALLVLPIVSGCIVATLSMWRELWVIGLGLLFIKSLNYALNQPTKEQLYIPTSRSVKYKAKAWTELFGMRLSKASGALANSLSTSVGLTLFVGVGTVMTLGLVGVWVFIALYLGNRHRKAIDTETVVC
jgi:ATP:ADP antiporter, AAA family